MKTKRATVQTETLFPELQNERRWETKGIFSDHYLRIRLRQSHLWPTDEIARPVYDFASEWWRKRYVGLAKGPEETTRREFLEKILERLGFSFFSNLGLPESERPQTPDYLLFEDEETKDRIFNDENEVKYQAAIGLMEAKKVHHPLDQVSKKETPGRFPHQQVRDYLTSAASKTGEPYFRWGILTSGDVWRLYCRDAHPSHYFEFHLAGPNDQFCSFGDFKIFLTLFQAQVFVRKDGRCALDDIREEAITFQTQLEEDLRERIFKVVADLANGFWSYKDNRLTQIDLPDLYDNCLIYLYRLLFVLYAEGRGLLPVKVSGAGSNKHYRERYSLQRFTPKLGKGTEFQSESFTDLYEELLKLFHLINGDKRSLNDLCGVPRYNGGLFNPKLHPKLEQWRVGEKALAQVLRDLMFSAGHRERAPQPGFEFGTIDYADLEVRQLGDIYEGLLGGHLELEGNTLFPRSERGALQISGTVYTPDWVVRFLVEKTLKPLIDEIERHHEVQDAIRRGKKDNSFALRVLKLNVLDKAMGSGHFVVRATEWLADEIVYHPTTKFEVETVPPGISQEQAEVAYWRRRVVEACIYGVDSNALAVELSKLSLWLTCIAVNEPLNFLDHHLRVANSLIGAKLDELSVLPVHQDANQIPFSFGRSLTEAVGDAIKEIEAIEEEASTEIDIVKKKEERWRDKVLERIEPFKRVANLWTGTTAGLELNESEYVSLASAFIDPPKPRSKEAQEFKKLWEKHSAECERITTSLQPFHWELEFPDVFFHDDGTRKENPGFDALLGNPPYISTQTSSAFEYRTALEQRFGFVDDLYVHFTFQGFNLLRSGGMFGYIVSDTFFTLSTKLPMRELLQRNRILYLGQCDPFTTTVDAAIFVAQKENAVENYLLDFIQARYATDRSTPEKELRDFAIKPSLLLMTGGENIVVNGGEQTVLHGAQGCLRLHTIGIDAYREASEAIFFEPTPPVIGLYNRYNTALKELMDEWWRKIESSKKFDQYRDEIYRYGQNLKAGDVTLLGLIAEGGQGLATANNGRFLGFLDGTQQAEEIKRREKQLADVWVQHPKVGPVFKSLLEQHEGRFEDVVEDLKSQFHQQRDLTLRKGELYRVVPPDLIATEKDYKKAYELRKQELEDFWRNSEPLKEAYDTHKKRFADDFCRLFQALVDFAQKRKLSISNVGIHAGEYYAVDSDGLRVATIFNGIDGRRSWIQFRKGDPEGNKWTSLEPLYIRWTTDNVQYLRTSKDSRWQGYQYFLKDGGVSWTRGANHVCIKARIQANCIYDVNGMQLSAIGSSPISDYILLDLINSNIFSFLLKKFINHTWMVQINDIRQMPIIIPSNEQANTLEELARRAIEAKELTLRKQDPSPKLIKYCRQLVKEQQRAPKYLQARPQLLLLDSSEDCLHAIELAVEWEVEKLYGVEGMGPFDEF